MIWGLSATLGNLDEAMRTLQGTADAGTDAVMVQGETDKTLVIDTLLPETAERFAWAGHMGLRMLPQVVEAIEASASLPGLHQHALAGRALVPRAAGGAARLGRRAGAAPRLAGPRGAGVGRARASRKAA